MGITWGQAIRLNDGVYPFSKLKKEISIDRLTKIAHTISLASEVNFEILRGLVEAFELGMVTKMDKAQLIDFLRANLKVAVEIKDDVEVLIKDDIQHATMVYVKIMLEDEIISMSKTELPVRF